MTGTDPTAMDGSDEASGNGADPIDNLGIVQHLVLALIAARPEDAWGGAIASLIAETTGRRKEKAQIYVLLKRLEKRGLIADTPDVRPEPSRRGRPSRLYRIAPSGLAALRTSAPVVSALARMIEDHVLPVDE